MPSANLEMSARAVARSWAACSRVTASLVSMPPLASRTSVTESESSGTFACVSIGRQLPQGFGIAADFLRCADRAVVVRKPASAFASSAPYRFEVSGVNWPRVVARGFDCFAHDFLSYGISVTCKRAGARDLDG